jgi:6-phosphogluconolactonase/glucosamine-6-phosphate isomerase/deaminase
MGDIERGQSNLAIPVRRDAGVDRVSVTPKLLGRIERIIFLVSGRQKCDIVDRLIDQPESIPAGRAVSDCENVELWFVE